MPEKKTLERAEKAKREGKAPTTQAGEFVREEMEHIREGKHGAESPEQAIAIGLSKARRAGVELPPPKKGTVSEKTRRSAERAYKAGQKAGNASPPRVLARPKARWSAKAVRLRPRRCWRRTRPRVAELAHTARTQDCARRTRRRTFGLFRP
jgi:hypothetical protein